MLFHYPPRPGQPILQSNSSYYGLCAAQVNRRPQFHYNFNTNYTNSSAPFNNYSSTSRYNKVGNNNKTNQRHVLSDTVFNKTIPNNLFFITRKQFAIIKCTHHIKSLSRTVPKTWNSWGSNINTSIKLAFSNAAIKEKITSSTKTFIDNLVDISIKHYQAVLSEAYKSCLLYTSPSPRD